MHRWLRQLPNLISGIRILLVVPIAVALARHLPITTFWLFGAAAASDALDGFLAKHFGWQTELGGMLDPIADKLMLSTTFVMLALLGSVPRWLTAAVLARDVIIVAGAVAYRMLLGPVPARPSAVSKLNTLCQVIYILVVIGAEQYPAVHAAELPLGALVFVTVVISGIDYVLVYSRQAAQASRGRRMTRAGGSTPA